MGIPYKDDIQLEIQVARGVGTIQHKLICKKRTLSVHIYEAS